MGVVRSMKLGNTMVAEEQKETPWHADREYPGPVVLRARWSKTMRELSQRSLNVRREGKHLIVNAF